MATEKPRWQFSLSSLLIVTTISAALFAGMRVLGAAPFAALLWAGGAGFVMVTIMSTMHRKVLSASMADPTSPQKIASFPDGYEAELIVDALANHDIRAHAVGGYTSGFQAESPGEVQVVVAQQDVQQALDVLSKYSLDAADIDWSQVDFDDPEDE